LEEVKIKNLIRNVLEFLMIILIPLIGISSAIITQINIEESTQFIVDNQTFTVTSSMTFHTIIIDAEYIVFNTTRFSISTDEEIMITLDYINNDIWNAVDNELILVYDVNQPNNNPSEYEISGFPPGCEYTIKREGITLFNKIADPSGKISFSTGKIGNHQFEFSQDGDQRSNQPPNIPTQPYPIDESYNIDISTMVTWSGGDPDGDTVTYDIYLGTTYPLELVKRSHTSNQYQPDPLDYSTEYFWQIEAWDIYEESTKGPTWRFTTQDFINNPPTIPTNPTPDDQSIDVDVHADLSWSCIDPDEDTIVYDIYFGKNTNPQLIAQDHPTSQYSLSMLDHTSTYYWRIICRDPYGQTNQSPLWSFTTSPQPNNPPDTPEKPIGETIIRCQKNISYSTSTIDPDGDPLFYIWSWGDESDIDIYGPYSSGEPCEVSHQWIQPGDFQIQVKARDIHYRETPWSPPLTISAFGPPIGDTHGPYYGYINEPITFNGSAQGGIPPYQWNWELDNNTYSTEKNPIHIYTNSGDHPVTLTITDSEGYQSKNQTICHIANTGDLNVIINSPFQADIYEEITFNGIADHGTPPYIWQWDFNDGSTSTKQQPTHMYTQKGTYHVTLTVSDQQGLTGDDHITLEIIDNREDLYPPTFTIEKPRINSFYLNDRKILGWPGILSIGDLTIEIDGSDDITGINFIEFYINDKLISTDHTPPYEWKWNQAGTLRNMITIRVYDKTGKYNQEDVQIWKLF